mmetsp:Transcript_3414/g.9073  ORF Transcript_3414/g.9073 Transcript_3414/m.9073 type:complete len:219 (+) Transcript_3414:863-1519(+)
MPPITRQRILLDQPLHRQDRNQGIALDLNLTKLMSPSFLSLLPLSLLSFRPNPYARLFRTFPRRLPSRAKLPPHDFPIRPPNSTDGSSGRIHEVTNHFRSSANALFENPSRNRSRSPLPSVGCLGPTRPARLGDDGTLRAAESSDSPSSHRHNRYDLTRGWFDGGVSGRNAEAQKRPSLDLPGCFAGPSGSASKRQGCSRRKHRKLGELEYRSACDCR